MDGGFLSQVSSLYQLPLSSLLASSDSVTSAWFFGLLTINVIGLVVSGLAHRSISAHDKADEKRDDENREIRKLVSDLTQSISAERDARQTDMKQQADRLWEFSGEVRESYMKRHEGLRLFGSIARRVEKASQSLGDKIENLPCNITRCPSQESES